MEHHAFRVNDMLPGTALTIMLGSAWLDGSVNLRQGELMNIASEAFFASHSERQGSEAPS
jgi:hypothetical protein